MRHICDLSPSHLPFAAFIYTAELVSLSQKKLSQAQIKKVSHTRVHWLDNPNYLEVYSGNDRCRLVHILTHPLTHSLMHSLTRSLTHTHTHVHLHASTTSIPTHPTSLTHSLTHSLIHSFTH